MPRHQFPKGHQLRLRHGHARNGRTTATYRAWHNAKMRCYNVGAIGYANYGGRGIGMCKRWRESFEDFLADMGEKPLGATLERKNNCGNYTPSNCRWISNREQQWNRRNNRCLTFRGKTLCVTEWAEHLGITAPAIFYRIKAGWSVKKILTTPTGKYERKRKYASEGR